MSFGRGLQLEAIQKTKEDIRVFKRMPGTIASSLREERKTDWLYPKIQRRPPPNLDDESVRSSGEKTLGQELQEMYKREFRDAAAVSSGHGRGKLQKKKVKSAPLVPRPESLKVQETDERLTGLCRGRGRGHRKINNATQGASSSSQQESLARIWEDLAGSLERTKLTSSSDGNSTEEYFTALSHQETDTESCFVDAD